MSNLTAAQYKSEMDAAYAQYDANNFLNIERGMAWVQVASVFAHLYTHQKLFDAKAIVPSAAALVYRTKAEGYLVNAKARANQAGNTPASVAASQAASVAAYAYVQITKIEQAS